MPQHENQMSATLDMLKIQSLAEATRMLDTQHAAILECTHAEVNAEIVSAMVDYIGLLTEHRGKIQELNVEEFAALKAELGLIPE
jgi:hypothetical protein